MRTLFHHTIDLVYLATLRELAGPHNLTVEHRELDPRRAARVQVEILLVGLRRSAACRGFSWLTATRRVERRRSRGKASGA